MNKSGNYVKLPLSSDVMCVENVSGIRPIEDRILIKVEKVETVTAGGIILPDDIRERKEMQQMTAEVVEIGPLTFEDYADGEPRPLKAGDTIVMAKYAGLLYTGDDKEEYRMIGLKDIVGVKT